MLAYQLGDEHAFAELYHRYANKIYGYLRSKLLNDSQVNDVFQLIYLKLHKSKHLYNSSLPFSPWIFTICRNELIDFFRKQQTLHEPFDEETHEVQVDLITENQEIDLSKLSQEQQTALKMRYYNDATFEEIADTLNTSPTNARQIVSRSIKYLRSFYEKQ
ncbi:sigma-70 family RNA polymerase sigma factor [bacterium]|nr:sigma-70 family RNA polymerase sigma factor [bacterium]